jgi:hypothetical protein
MGTGTAITLDGKTRLVRRVSFPAYDPIDLAART